MFSIRLLRPAVLAGVFSLSLSFPAQASNPPTDATGRCNVIRAYEALCGNLRPNGCLGKDGVDYWDNLSHQQTWDNYYNLCIYNITPAKDRYSHECLEHFGLASSCPSTVEPLVEYTAVTTVQYNATIREEERYSIANTGTIQACYLLSETRAKLDAYRNACAEVKPSACSVGGSVESNYMAICGDQKPCECLHGMNCGPACPAPPPSGGEAIPEASAGAGSGGGGGGETASEGVPPLPEVTGESGGDSNIALGGDSKAPGGRGENAVAGAKGCALMVAATESAGDFWLVSSLVFGGWAWRFRRRFQ